MSLINKKSSLFLLLVALIAGSITQQSSAKMSGWTKVGLGLAAYTACGYVALKNIDTLNSFTNNLRAKKFGSLAYAAIALTALPAMVLASPIAVLNIEENIRRRQISNFIDAAVEGDISTIKRYLNRGYQPHVWGVKNYTFKMLSLNELSTTGAYNQYYLQMPENNSNPFLEAAVHSKPQALEIMLKSASFTIDQGLKYRALCIATANNDSESVKLLLDHDTSPKSYLAIEKVERVNKRNESNYQNKLDYTVPLLHNAIVIKRISTEIFKLLFNAEPEYAKKHIIGDVLGRYEHGSLLSKAIESKRYDILDFLLQSPANASYSTIKEALHMADVRKDTKAITIIIKNKPHEVNKLLLLEERVHEAKGVLWRKTFFDENLLVRQEIERIAALSIQSVLVDSETGHQDARGDLAKIVAEYHI